MNAAARDGTTPLHNAAMNLSVRMIKLLLEHGARRDVLTTDGVSPLQYARDELEDGETVPAAVRRLLRSKWDAVAGAHTSRG